MSNFWAFFQLHPINDDAEDLVLKLFSATLHGNARIWYDNLLAASITSMDQLEETLLPKILMMLYFMMGEIRRR
jgi:hypothetical protein